MRSFTDKQRIDWLAENGGENGALIGPQSSFHKWILREHKYQSSDDGRIFKSLRAAIDAGIRQGRKQKKAEAR